MNAKIGVLIVAAVGGGSLTGAWTAASVVTIDLGPVSPDAAVERAAAALLGGDKQTEPAPTRAQTPGLEAVKARRLAHVIIPAPGPAPSLPTLPTPRPVQTEAGNPGRDATLIEVPTNTLGPGEPLWVQSDRQAAEARIARADAQIAEREAARPSYYDDYYDEDVVVYGPHAPSWGVRAWHQPGLRRRPVVTPHGPITTRTDDLFDRAQLKFGRIAYPKNTATVDGQLEAQKKFGEVASPPIARIQKQIDQAQIISRKGAPKPK
jgi:hypothetical protein